MKGFKPFPVLGLTVIFYTLVMTACGGKLPANGAGALNFVTMSPLTTGAEGDPYQQTIQATGGVQPYTWDLESGTLPPGFTFSSAGVLSGTPPSGSGGTSGTAYTFVVRVTDSQSPVKAYDTQAFTLTINPPLSFTTSTLVNGVIGAPYTNTINSATGGVNCMPPQLSGCYTYTIAPGSAPLPAGLSLNSVSGKITGTPTGPIGTYQFVIQATDGFPSTATAIFSITITAKVQGSYVFSLNGYNQQGQAFFMAGSIVTDGGGNITSGVFDRNGNDSTGVVKNVMITPGSGGNGSQCPAATGPPSGSGSVYCVGRPGVTNGSNLGTMVFVSSLGTYSFSVSVSLTGDSRIMLADPNNPGTWGSGVLKPQGSLAGVTLTSGNFAFGSFGVDGSNKRYASAGFFITDATGNISSTSCSTPPCGEADINDNGTVQSKVTLSGSVSSVDSNTGRATAAFTVGSTTLDYALYVVPGKPSSTLVAVQTDPVSRSVPLTLASIVQRQAAAGGGFTNLSLNATRGNSTNGVVFELNAVSNSSAADVSLGLGNFDGAGNITSYTFDENNGGTLTTPSQNNYMGTYSVDSTNLQSGRVTVNLGGVTNQPVWYLITFNTGFVVGTDPNVTSGTFEPQIVVQPIFITALFGLFAGGTSNPVLPSVINEVQAVNANPPPPPGMGTGTYATTFDSSGTTGVMMNQMFTGPSCLSESNTCPSVQEGQSAIGRFLILDSSGNPADILYVVSSSTAGITGLATKNATMSAGANPSLTPIVQ